jgi:vacuolar protein sorting-associated protein 13D
MQKQLCIRLSYNDVRLMQTMLQSLQWQSEKASHSKLTSVATPSQSNNHLVSKLTSLGFRESDCLMALAICDQEIDDAAIWLTQNAEPTNKAAAGKVNAASNGPLDIIAVDVKASCISICVIDDCKDADVPLLEFSLSHLNLRQELGGGVGNLTVDTLNVLKDSLNQEAASRSGALAMSRFKAGHLSGVFASDYYNRALSGWEPISEPWKCEAAWSYSFGQSGVRRNRLHLKIDSMDTLRLNLTSTLIELYELVKENWMQDYYAATSSPGK